ncbi:hypothetical protein C7974DRAFT_396279 [Boeremia exigua]|uniref:uncharacterized protein n=1 Tax=Boeremia exigua TaxID=749465 RepID=UPI001E8CD35C|nr:uncharacterized protein C7974DRAFT_396279 [Boeremia exigua]KAH6625551.1 hypothetical protein C7974DRAFT_396279 [Boeremia exigua]
MEESSGFHPIACESCRNKKSKCSREIPICSQCTVTGVTCRYPQINKRGIPSGYVSLIEQRLHETEIFVLEVLSVLQELGASVEQRHRLSNNQRQLLTDIAQKQLKSDKIEEWKSSPLGTDQQRQAWWTAKRDCISRPDTSSTHEMLDTDINDASEFSPDVFESMGDFESVFSPVQPSTQRTLLAVGSPAGLSEEAGNRVHITVATDVRPLEVDKVAATPPLPPASPISIRSRAEPADKWRKYF